MSEERNEPKYCNTDDLWRWIQNQGRRIENQLKDSKDYNAEGVSAMLLGRREMLLLLCDWLTQNEVKMEEKK
jgi:hypothetical protein